MLQMMTDGPQTPIADRWHGRALTGEAITLIALATFARAMLPMRWWAGVLGSVRPVPTAWTEYPDRTMPTAADNQLEASVSWAVHRGVRWLPGQPSCLAPAAAAQIMLRRRGASGVVVIGLRRNPDSTWDAHAWLVGRRGAVVGGPAADGFQPTMVLAVPSGLEPDDINVTPGD